MHSDDPAHRNMGLISGSLYHQSLGPYREQFGDQLLILLHDDVKADAPGVYRTALQHIGADDSFRPDSLTEVRQSNQEGGAQRPRTVSQEDRVALYEYFRDDVDRLSALIDRDLGMWDPAVSRVR